MHIYLRLTNVSVFRLKIIFYRHTCGYPFVCNQLEILRGECTSYICLFPTRIWCSVVFSIQGYGELCIHIKKLKFNGTSFSWQNCFLTYEKIAFEILIYNQVSEECLEKRKQRVPVSNSSLKGISQGRIQRAQICLYSIHSLCRSPRDLE